MLDKIAAAKQGEVYILPASAIELMVKMSHTAGRVYQNDRNTRMLEELIGKATT